MTREELSTARLILDYEDFSVFKVENGGYWVVRHDEPEEEPAELDLIARLEFPSGILAAQMKECGGKKGFEHKLVSLYDADFTGEAEDDSFAYLWFCYRPIPKKWILPDSDDISEEK